MIAVVILMVLVTVLSVYSAFGTYQNQQDIKALTEMLKEQETYEGIDGKMYPKDW